MKRKICDQDENNEKHSLLKPTQNTIKPQVVGNNISPLFPVINNNRVVFLGNCDGTQNDFNRNKYDDDSSEQDDFCLNNRVTETTCDVVKKYNTNGKIVDVIATKNFILTLYEDGNVLFDGSLYQISNNGKKNNTPFFCKPQAECIASNVKKIFGRETVSHYCNNNIQIMYDNIFLILNDGRLVTFRTIDGESFNMIIDKFFEEKELDSVILDEYSIFYYTKCGDIYVETQMMRSFFTKEKIEKIETNEPYYLDNIENVLFFLPIESKLIVVDINNSITIFGDDDDDDDNLKKLKIAMNWCLDNCNNPNIDNNIRIVDISSSTSQHNEISSNVNNSIDIVDTSQYYDVCSNIDVVNPNEDNKTFIKKKYSNYEINLHDQNVFVYKKSRKNVDIHSLFTNYNQDDDAFYEIYFSCGNYNFKITDDYCIHIEKRINETHEFSTYSMQNVVYDKTNNILKIKRTRQNTLIEIDKNTIKIITYVNEKIDKDSCVNYQNMLFFPENVEISEEGDIRRDNEIINNTDYNLFELNPIMSVSKRHASTFKGFCLISKFEIDILRYPLIKIGPNFVN